MNPSVIFKTVKLSNTMIKPFVIYCVHNNRAQLSPRAKLLLPLKVQLRKGRRFHAGRGGRENEQKNSREDTKGTVKRRSSSRHQSRYLNCSPWKICTGAGGHFLKEQPMESPLSMGGKEQQKWLHASLGRMRSLE